MRRRRWAAYLLDRQPVEPAVIALAQPGVLVDRETPASERNLCRFDGPRQIGDEDGGDGLAAMAGAEIGSLLPPFRRQAPWQPTRGDAGCVVGRNRVRFGDNLDGHRVSRLLRP